MWRAGNGRVGAVGFEPTASSASRKRSPPELSARQGGHDTAAPPRWQDRPVSVVDVYPRPERYQRVEDVHRGHRHAYAPVAGRIRRHRIRTVDGVASVKVDRLVKQAQGAPAPVRQLPLCGEGARWRAPSLSGRWRWGWFSSTTLVYYEQEHLLRQVYLYPGPCRVVDAPAGARRRPIGTTRRSPAVPVRSRPSIF